MPPLPLSAFPPSLNAAVLSALTISAGSTLCLSSCASVLKSRSAFELHHRVLKTQSGSLSRIWRSDQAARPKSRALTCLHNRNPSQLHQPTQPCSTQPRFASRVKSSISSLRISAHGQLKLYGAFPVFDGFAILSWIRYVFRHSSP
ncbi:hypothetical protein B0H19DRAFT_533972 [Mycena capillaripes]|nr:hypothetical protein B0H19DRAFT_533972 [Mycena capillaripes]